MNYEDMLKKAFENMPESVVEKQRFEVPSVKGHIQGNKTVIINFMQIAAHIRRDYQHILKFCVSSFRLSPFATTL